MEEYQLIPETIKENNNNNVTKDIICNICKENCFIEINDYVFTLYGCKNHHVTNNILFKNFEETQKIQLAKQRSYEQEKDKYNCKEHNGEQFIKYCKDHNKDICIQCENEHKNCSTIYYGDILPNKAQLDYEQLKEYINKFEKEINEIIKNLKYIKDNLEIYYNISKNIINEFIKRNKRNYQVLENINQFIKFNSKIIDNIKGAINNNKMLEKYKNIIDIFESIKGIKYTNYILVEIEIQEKDKNKGVKIINNDIYPIHNDHIYDFDPFFLNYNYNSFNSEINPKNVRIEIDGKMIGFSNYYKFKEKGIHKLKYYFNSFITNFSSIFAGCEDIIKIDMTNFHTKNITNISSMFYGCISLKNINLSNFNTEKVTNMNNMFNGSKSLEKIDLSNFNTKNVSNMDNMFNGCKSLKNIAQIKTNDERIIHQLNSCKIF